MNLGHYYHSPPSWSMETIPFASFIRRLGEAARADGHPELRTVLQEISERMQADACVLWEPSLDFTVVPQTAAGKLYAIDSTLPEQVRVAHAAVPADPINDFSARFFRNAETRAWHNNFYEADAQSASREVMERLSLRKVCAARLEFGSLTDKPGHQMARGKEGLISIYRREKTKDFDAQDERALTSLAAFIPSLYRLLSDRKVLELFADVRHLLGQLRPDSGDDYGLQQVSEYIRKTFRCREVSIFLRNPLGAAGQFELLGTTYPPAKVQCKLYYGQKSEGLTGWVLNERSPVLIPDLTRYGEQANEIDQLYPGISWKDSGGVFDHAPELLNLRPNDSLPPISFMACPIQTGSELYGCIRCAIGTDPYYFSWRELIILENVSAFIAETWAQEVEKELWHCLLGSVEKLSASFHQQITEGDYDRSKLYQSAAASIDRERFRGCEIITFRILEDAKATRLRLVAMNADPGIYSGEAVAQFLAQPRTFDASGGSRSLGSCLLGDQASEPSRVFDLNGEGDAEEQEFFRAAKHVLSTAIKIDQTRHGVFDLAFSSAQHLSAVLPQMAKFTEMFARNIALHEFRGEQHGRLRDLLNTQIETYANVSHQLRSPLGTAVKRGQLLVERLRNPEAARGFAVEQEMPIILGQCRKAFRVSSFLDVFAKVSRGQEIVANIQMHSLGALWKVVIESLLDHRFAIGRLSNVNFDAHQFEALRNRDPDVRVVVDLRGTEQVIDAVVGNAFKYSRRGELVKVSGDLQANRLTLTVISRGVRLTPEDARSCTLKFWRGEEARDADADGSGLGLYLASLLMEAQKGSLNVSPTNERGETHISLTFPIFRPFL